MATGISIATTEPTDVDARPSTKNIEGVRLPILIVGAGPVGLMMAYLLLEQGYPVAIADKRLFTRRQVVALDTQFWNILPRSVKEKLVIRGGCQFRRGYGCVGVTEVKEFIDKTGGGSGSSYSVYGVPNEPLSSLTQSSKSLPGDLVVQVL